MTQRISEIFAPLKPLLDTFSLTELDAFFGLIVTPILFFFFWKLMGAYVFGPFLRLTEEREAATAGAQGSADAIKKDIASREQKLEESLLTARSEALQKRSREVAEANKEANAIIATAENSAKDFLKKSRSETEAQQEKLRSELFSKSEELISNALQAVTKAPEVLTSRSQAAH